MTQESTTYKDLCAEKGEIQRIRVPGLWATAVWEAVGHSCSLHGASKVVLCAPHPPPASHGGSAPSTASLFKIISSQIRSSAGPAKERVVMLDGPLPRLPPFPLPGLYFLFQSCSQSEFDDFPRCLATTQACKHWENSSEFSCTLERLGMTTGSGGIAQEIDKP